MPHVALLGSTVGPVLFEDMLGVPLDEDSLDPEVDVDVLGPVVVVVVVEVVLEADETQHLKLSGPGQKFLKE